MNTLARRSFSLGVAVALGATLIGCGARQRTDGGKGLLPEGTAAPDLRATDQDGKAHAITDERGHPLVVYFYPRDATPGCTKEACAFRDVWKKFEAAGVQVFGVSSDDQASHAAFAREHKLTFPLLSDVDNTWAKAFGVPSTLGMYSRVTFLLDPSGKVAKVYPDVDPGVHAERVLADAAALRR
jgi:thioredoxin-dependent peroxiredoxin